MTDSRQACSALNSFSVEFGRIRWNSLCPTKHNGENFPEIARNRQKSPETARNEEHRKSQSFAEKCTVVAV